MKIIVSGGTGLIGSDPDAQRYEAVFRAFLDAVEATEGGSRPGRPPSTEAPENVEIAGICPTGPDRRRHWRQLAACRHADPELFFPVSASGPSLDQITKAKAICADCPVRRQCLVFALGTRQEHGVWGGMSEQERRQQAGKACTRT